MEMASALKREIVIRKSALRILSVLVFALLTGLGSYVRLPLPFTPVPITLQTFFVLLSAALLGSRLGFSSQLAYVILGVAGVPIFAQAGAGLAYLSGPTAGYLFGFLIVSLFASLFIKAGQTLARTLVILATADLLILASGTLWLKFILGVSFFQAISMGFLPFLIGDLLKVCAASCLAVRLRKRFQAALL